MKKNGFTLIELLAVIVILAIIAIITVPMIMNVIDKAKLGALEDSAYGLVESANLYYAENIKEGITSDITFIPDETKKGMYSSDLKLNYKGSLPETGSEVVLKVDGKVGIKLVSGDYCAVKSTSDTKVTILKNDCITAIDGSSSGNDTSVSELQKIIGTTDISSIGDGTITGAIAELNGSSKKYTVHFTMKQGWNVIEVNIDGAIDGTWHFFPSIYTTAYRTFTAPYLINLDHSVAKFAVYNSDTNASVVEADLHVLCAK